MEAVNLLEALGAPVPHVTEMLLQASARNEFNYLNAVREVVERVDGLNDPATALTSLCYDIAIRGPETDERLRSPALRAWSSGFTRIEDWSANNPALSAQLALVDNMRFSLLSDGDWEGSFAVLDTICAGWDCRVALGGLQEKSVRLEKLGTHLVVRAPGNQAITLDLADAADQRVLRAPYFPDSQIVVRNDLPLFKLRVREEAVLTRHAVEYGDFDTRTSSYGPFDASEFRSAADLLRKIWPEEYDDWKKTLRIVVPRNVPQGWKMDGCTVGTYQGACWIGARGFPGLLESLVHEQSHVKLRYIQESWPILDDSQSDRAFVVGWRRDPRPLVGIYEGVYVHLHVAEAMERLIDQEALDEDMLSRCRERRDEVCAQIREAKDVLKENAKFTPQGEAFLRWADEAVTRY